MFAKIGTWGVLFIISLLVSLFGINQGVIFWCIYTVCQVFILWVMNSKMRGDQALKSALCSICPYVVAYVISGWFGFNFCTSFEVITFVIALLVTFY